MVVRVAIGLTSRRSVLPRDEPAVGDVFVSSVKGPPATSFGHFGKKYLDLRFCNTLAILEKISKSLFFKISI